MRKLERTLREMKVEPLWAEELEALAAAGRTRSRLSDTSDLVTNLGAPNVGWMFKDPEGDGLRGTGSYGVSAADLLMMERERMASQFGTGWGHSKFGSSQLASRLMSESPSGFPSASMMEPDVPSSSAAPSAFQYSQKNFHSADGNLYSIFSPFQSRKSTAKPSFLRGKQLADDVETIPASAEGKGCYSNDRLSNRNKRYKLKFHNQDVPPQYRHADPHESKSTSDSGIPGSSSSAETGSSSRTHHTTRVNISRSSFKSSSSTSSSRKSYSESLHSSFSGEDNGRPEHQLNSDFFSPKSSGYSAFGEEGSSRQEHQPHSDFFSPKAGGDEFDKDMDDLLERSRRAREFGSGGGGGGGSSQRDDDKRSAEHDPFEVLDLSKSRYEKLFKDYENDKKEDDTWDSLKGEGSTSRLRRLLRNRKSGFDMSVFEDSDDGEDLDKPLNLCIADELKKRSQERKQRRSQFGVDSDFSENLKAESMDAQRDTTKERRRVDCQSPFSAARERFESRRQSLFGDQQRSKVDDEMLRPNSHFAARDSTGRPSSTFSFRSVSPDIVDQHKNLHDDGSRASVSGSVSPHYAASRSSSGSGLGSTKRGHSEEEEDEQHKDKGRQGRRNTFEEVEMEFSDALDLSIKNHHRTEYKSKTYLVKEQNEPWVVPSPEPSVSPAAPGTGVGKRKVPVISQMLENMSIWDEDTKSPRPPERLSSPAPSSCGSKDKEPIQTNTRPVFPEMAFQSWREKMNLTDENTLSLAERIHQEYETMKRDFAEKKAMLFSPSSTKTTEQAMPMVIPNSSNPVSKPTQQSATMMTPTTTTSPFETSTELNTNPSQINTSLLGPSSYYLFVPTNALLHPITPSVYLTTPIQQPQQNLSSSPKVEDTVEHPTNEKITIHVPSAVNTTFELPQPGMINSPICNLNTITKTSPVLDRKLKTIQSKANVNYPREAKSPSRGGTRQKRLGTDFSTTSHRKGCGLAGTTLQKTSSSDRPQFSNDISICKFKLIKGVQPMLEEKKSFFVPLPRSAKQLEEDQQQAADLAASASGIYSTKTPATTSATGPGEKFRTYKIHVGSQEEIGRKLAAASARGSGAAASNKMRRRSRKAIAREKLEATFREQGFLIKTQQVDSAEGAVYCKFRQLKKFTRYLFKSWKNYLPKELEEMSATSGEGGGFESYRGLAHGNARIGPGGVFESSIGNTGISGSASESAIALSMQAHNFPEATLPVHSFSCSSLPPPAFRCWSPGGATSCSSSVSGTSGVGTSILTDPATPDVDVGRTCINDGASMGTADVASLSDAASILSGGLPSLPSSDT